MVIHDTVGTAVHVQPGLLVVTLNVPVPPLGSKSPVVGESVIVQPLSWLTVNVCPAIVKVPVLAKPAFAAIVKFTVPLPLPDAPLVIVYHEALAVATVLDHVQPLLVVTVTLNAVPAAETLLADVDESV